MGDETLPCGTCKGRGSVSTSRWATVTPSDATVTRSRMTGGQTTECPACHGTGREENGNE